jgi:hypothetical protein
LHEKGVVFTSAIPEQFVGRRGRGLGSLSLDGTPGAKEAGVVHFIDRILLTLEKDRQVQYREGLQLLRRKLAESPAGVSALPELSEARQVQLLKSIEQTEFFEIVRMHTIAGFLSDPTYGGNNNGVGWRLIGFDDQFAFEPPFGFCDQDAQRGG